ncbi:MAG: hypothetical protein ACR2L6_00180 [Gemmatimonadaceae bacterium]
MSAPADEAGAVRIYIDAQALDAQRGVTPLDALERHDAAAAAAVRDGSRVIVDHRGLPVTQEDRVTNGSIFRVVSAKQAS